MTINIPTSIISNPELTSSEKLSLAVIAQISSNWNKSFTYSNHFFVDTGLARSERTVAWVLKRLKDLGYISVEFHYDGPIKIRRITIDRDKY